MGIMVLGRAMRHTLTLAFGIVAAVIGWGPMTPASGTTPSASATAKVVVHVKPRIAVAATTPVVHVGTIETGNVSATVGFRVESNAGAVEMFVSATGLYKGGVAEGPTVAPIPLDASRGVRIDASEARPQGGRSNVAAFTGHGQIEEFPARVTERIAFESKQKGRFSQDVRIGVAWNQNDAAKPPGDYAGRVRLTAMVLP